MSFDLVRDAAGDGALFAVMREAEQLVATAIRHAHPTAGSAMVAELERIAEAGMREGLAKLEAIGKHAVLQFGPQTMFDHGLIHVGIDPTTVPSPYH